MNDYRCLLEEFNESYPNVDTMSIFIFLVQVQYRNMNPCYWDMWLRKHETDLYAINVKKCVHNVELFIEWYEQREKER